MPFRMQLARQAHGAWPEGDERTPGSDQTYPAGTPVTFATGSQELDEHPGGATVIDVLGVSLEGVNAGVADNPSGKVSFASANRENVFMAKLTNGAGVVQTADEANINVAYGILKNGTGLNQWWSVDESDVAAPVVEVEGIDTERNIVFFKWIESAIQQP